MRASYTNEVGAKFILSRTALDRIVMVGSSETWNRTPEEREALSGKRFRELPPRSREDRPPDKALPYLVRKLSEFLRGEDLVLVFRELEEIRVVLRHEGRIDDFLKQIIGIEIHGRFLGKTGEMFIFGIM